MNIQAKPKAGTVTVKLQQPSKPSRSKKRRQRRNKNKAWINVDTPLKASIEQPSGRTTKVRIPRALQLGLLNRSKLSFNDVDILNGSSDLLQTLILPEMGVHRGTAKGVETTAVCRYKITQTANVSAANTLVFSIIPGVLTGGVNVGAFVSIASSSWASATTAYPYGAGTVPIAGPFTSVNPSNSSRVVGCSIKIFPIGSVLQQGGEIVVSYLPEGAYYLATDVGVGYTRSFIDNLEMMYVGKGTEPVIANWFPCEAETVIRPSTLATVNDSRPVTGVVGYMSNAGTSTISYRIDIEFAIEYIPNGAYRPFVDRKPAIIQTACWHYLNLFIAEHWRDYFLTDYNKYLQNIMYLESHNPGFTNMYEAKQLGPLGAGGAMGSGNIDVGPGGFVKGAQSILGNPVIGELVEAGCNAVTGGDDLGWCRLARETVVGPQRTVLDSVMHGAGF